MTLKEIQDITGLPFRTKGNKFIAACYLDGSPHSRPDKINAKVHAKYGVMISEEGGECISLKAWVDLYGDGRDIKVDRKLDKEKQIERIFVDPIHYESTIPATYSGNLFKFLSDIFGAKRVAEVFYRYNVGEDGNEMIFWRTTTSGNVCYDSRISYGSNGKRDKDRGGYRKHLTGDGYNSKCIFGQHLLLNFNGRVNVVESEKSAIILTLADKGMKNRLWLASGGANQTGLIRDEWFKYGDYDKAGLAWNGVKWYEGYEVKEGWDIADLALELINNK